MTASARRNLAARSPTKDWQFIEVVNQLNSSKSKPSLFLKFIFNFYKLVTKNWHLDEFTYIRVFINLLKQEEK